MKQALNMHTYQCLQLLPLLLLGSLTPHVQRNVTRQSAQLSSHLKLKEISRHSPNRNKLITNSASDRAGDNQGLGAIRSRPLSLDVSCDDGPMGRLDEELVHIFCCVLSDVRGQTFQRAQLGT